MKAVKNTYKIVLLILLLITATVLCFACSKRKTSEISVCYQADDGGYIQGETVQTVEMNGIAESVTAVPYDGYNFVEWSDGLKTPERKDNNLQTDLTVTARFSAQKFSVQYKTDCYGFIDGKSEQVVEYGQNTNSVTAVPYAGFRFVKWSDGITAPTRNDTNIIADLNVCALFEKRIYNIQYKAESGGIIEGISNQQLTYNDITSTVIAKPSKNHLFVGWSDGNTSPSRQDKVTDDLNIIARFVYTKTCTIQYKATDGGRILGDNTQTVPENKQGKLVTAEPETGYVFTGWSDGYPSAERIDLAVTDKTVTASFRYAFDGQGTQESPYRIDSYQALLDMRQHPKAHFILTRDLDLSGIEHIPLFDDVFRFMGTFDGNNHTIINLAVDTDDNFASLFGFCDGDILRLKLTAANITVPNTTQSPVCVGTVCAVTNGTLTDIQVSGTIHTDNLDNRYTYIGGLVGLTFNSVQNCISNICISIKDSLPTPPIGIIGLLNVGGLIGRSYSDIISCRSTGKITLTSDGGTTNVDARFAGGLVGVCSDSELDGALTVKNCESDIVINAECAAACGGLLGDFSIPNAEVNVNNCHARGNANCKQGTVGGLAYVINVGANSLITNCSYIGNISGNNASGFTYILSSQYENTILDNCFSSGTVQGIYSGEGFSNSSTLSEITNCYSESNVSARRVAGFIYSASGIISHCYANCEITCLGSDITSGFISVLSGTAEECYSSGTIYATKVCSAFIFNSRGIVKNCYSTSDIIITLKNTQTSTLTCGLIAVNYMSVTNCYYSGKISAICIPDRHLTATLVSINNGSISNCHWLYNEDSLAQDAVARDNGTTESVYIYNNVEDMFFIADLLNDGTDNIWTNIEGSTPIFKK